MSKNLSTLEEKLRSKDDLDNILKDLNMVKSLCDKLLQLHSD